MAVKINFDSTKIKSYDYYNRIILENGKVPYTFAPHREEQTNFICRTVVGSLRGYSSPPLTLSEEHVRLIFNDIINDISEDLIKKVNFDENFVEVKFVDTEENPLKVDKINDANGVFKIINDNIILTSLKIKFNFTKDILVDELLDSEIRNMLKNKITIFPKFKILTAFKYDDTDTLIEDEYVSEDWSHPNVQSSLCMGDIAMWININKRYLSIKNIAEFVSTINYQSAYFNESRTKFYLGNRVLDDVVMQLEGN